MMKKVIPVVVLIPIAVIAAVFTTTLQSGAVTVWDRYIQTAERHGPRSPLLDVSSGNVSLIDLNPDGDNAGEDLPNAYIHHWLGAVQIPNSTVASVEAVLKDYPNYPAIYAPDIKFASGVSSGDGQYDVRLVTEQIQGVLHFAFDMKSQVIYRKMDGDALVESRSYSIRESNSGHAPYTDLLPEGKDHGILWRLNSYWRLRQTGTSVYAECQAISLSRKPLPGTHDLVKSRAKDSLEQTLQQTRKACSARTLACATGGLQRGRREQN